MCVTRPSTRATGTCNRPDHYPMPCKHLRAQQQAASELTVLRIEACTQAYRAKFVVGVFAQWQIVSLHPTVALQLSLALALRMHFNLPLLMTSENIISHTLGTFSTSICPGTAIQSPSSANRRFTINDCGLVGDLQSRP